MSPRAYERAASRLHGEAEQLFAQGQHAEAERKVRRLLRLQRRVVGRQHPDFALGLSMLGELRFLQDDLAGAEACFRRSLAVRGRVLGHQDPDYAVSLVCLGGVLWRRGEVEEAERRFREALAVRYETLGARHPDSVQTRKELARLLRRRGDWAGAQALALDPGVLAPEGPARSDPSSEVLVLSADFARLGQTLASAARLLRSPGAPVPAEYVEDLARCRGRYEALRDETLRRIAHLQVPPPAPRLLGTLQDLAALLEDLAEAEGLHAVRELVRRRALTLLERVLALEYTGKDDFPPLRECQERARQLVETIAAEHWSELPAQTEALAEGTHALVGLLTLVEDRELLSDREWAELHEQVGEALGSPIARAASRARLFVAEARNAPPAPEFAAAPVIPAQRVDAVAEPVASEVTHAAPEPAPRPPQAPAPAPARPAPRRPTRVAAPVPSLDPRVALMRDLAVASLVPTMGKVINLPSASPSERETHRLMKVGQAPNVVERRSAAEAAPSARQDHPGRRFATEVARRYATYHRIGRGVIAGPLSLIQPQATSNDHVGPAGLLGATVVSALTGDHQAGPSSPTDR